MKSTTWLINLGVILVFAALLGVIFSAAVEGIHLGDFVDGEADGLPDAAALGDDLDQDPDDEDGGLFSSPLFAGHAANLDVVASTEGRLDAWLDFNQDGDWTDNGEQIFLAQELQTGPNNLTFIVPRDATTGLTFSRLRFSLDGGLSFDGPAPEGEVEDYRVDIQIPSPEPVWAKWVNDEPWFPELLVNVETSQTITVTDVITTFADFHLYEDWDPAHLTLRDVTVTTGDVERGEDSLEWSGVAPPSGVVTLTKWFHVEPCTWNVTVLSETLEVPIVPFPERPVIIEKEAPVLWIDVDDHDPEIVAGLPTTFTLLYGNDGGYENDVMIRNDFPPEAPFTSSEPEPNRQDPEGLWVEWDVGDLEKGHQDRISVTVAIDPLLEPTTILTVTDVIYDHTSEPVGSVEIPFQVTEPHRAEWEKLVNGRTWVPGMAVTLQTSQTVTVTDVITTHPKARFILRETWNPEHLTLRDAYVDPPEASRLISAPGSLDWHAWVDHAETITLTKIFHVEPSDWPDTVLLEELVGLQVPDSVRPVTINKMLPNLWIDVDDYDPEVAAGDLVSFTLLYGNDGGYENDVMIRNDFPPEAPFASSEPTPNRQDPEGLWVEWDVGDLEMEQEERISVTVAFDPLLQPTTTLTITDVIYDHTGEPVGSVEIPFHVARPPAGEWEKQVYGRPWIPDMTFNVQPSQTITVTDVVTTLPGAPFYLIEAWNPDHLTLRDAYVDPPEAPQPSSGVGSLDWRVDPDHAEVLTLTKVFHVEAGTWRTTVLREELEGLDVTHPVRQVSFTAPFRLFLPIIERNYAPTTLDGQRQALAETPARPPTRLSRRRTMRR
ncbi:MAG: GEVED domain-containing protein [Anaerolineae bacterium]